MFSVLVIRLRSLRLLRVSGIVMRLRMFLLLITFLKASHSFRNRLPVICKNAYLIGRAVQQECRDRGRMPCSARKKPRFGGMKTYIWESVNPDGYLLDILEPIPSALPSFHSFPTRRSSDLC